MITDDDVMHIFRQADPARIDDGAPVATAAEYLEELRSRAELVPIGEDSPAGSGRMASRPWLRGLAAVAAVASIVAAGVVLAGRNRTDTVVPVATPTIPTPPVELDPVELASAYVDAIAALDADRAASYLTDSGIERAGGLEQLRLDVAWKRSTAFTIFAGDCDIRSTSTRGDVVRCPFDFQGLRSDELDLGPYGGSYYQLTIREGRIQSVSAVIETGRNGFSRDMWEPLAAWISATYPDDVAVMYTDSSMSDYHLSPESIDLWEARTLEYVEYVQGGATETAP